MKKLSLLWINRLTLAIAFAGLTATASAQAGKGLADFNVAAEKDLLALPHLNADLTKQLLEQRPFLSITNVDALLAGSLSPEQRTELYGKAFIHVNLNTAPRAELMLIPNLGNRMAHEFEEYRPYRAMAQFRREIGKYVNAQEVARLEQYVFIPIKLNTASDEDILSIPGIGPRMLHEFKEYRPYRNIEQFRREIGKYVNQKELSRLERYVVVE